MLKIYAATTIPSACMTRLTGLPWSKWTILVHFYFPIYRLEHKGISSLTDINSLVHLDQETGASHVSTRVGMLALFSPVRSSNSHHNGWMGEKYFRGGPI